MGAKFFSLFFSVSNELSILVGERLMFYSLFNYEEASLFEVGLLPGGWNGEEMCLT